MKGEFNIRIMEVKSSRDMPRHHKTPAGLWYILIKPEFPQHKNRRLKNYLCKPEKKAIAIKATAFFYPASETLTN